MHSANFATLQESRVQNHPDCLPSQFDIVNIPPAPRDVPRIQVTFHLGKDLILTAEAKDLDTERHKLWLQRGEIIVLKH